jgi:hypothetical protein
VATIAAVVIAVPSGAFAQPTPSPQPSLAGNVPLNFPAAPPGRVAVATSSPPYRNVVSFVVRNGSSTPVDRLKVSVTARGADRKVVGRGSTTRIVPSAVNPNEVAVGGVRLNKPARPGATYEFKVSSHRLRHAVSTPALQVTNTTLSGPMVGAVAQTLMVEARNTGRHSLRGPITVLALCLNQANHPVLAAAAKGAKPGLRAGASSSFTIAFSALCPAYLVGARSR